MPLHEYKTQVLLLHSEQSTLDNLSSGFNDRYTVHCATSGSEALNTLVETPINIIVTAQDLPGMSGLDALREAKKRSPDTVGILLAGNSTDRLEALVGEKEVFQIVRGNVTSDAILKLVDDATQQMRLMALAESANDTAANVDEPSEHIIMETSEHGAPIISDGTGRMPVLDPKKVSADAAVGAQTVDVLVLTKDQEFLTTIKDSSRGMHTVHYATTLSQADETIRKYQVGVAVVDAAMVGDKVEQLTQHLRKGSSRLVSIVAGRRDDGEMLMDLINRGKVYRFLLKPVSPGRARLAVEASVKHHLEAPDSAFKLKGAAATSETVAKPAPKAKAKAPAPAAPKAEAKPAKKAEKTDKPKLAVPGDPPLGSAKPADDFSPVDERLDSAFGDADSGFTETVTGLISSVGKKFSSNEDKGRSKGKSEPAGIVKAAVASGSGGSLLQNKKILGVAAAAIVVIAGALFWLMSGSDDVAPVEEAPVISTPDIAETDSEDDAPASGNADTDLDATLDEARLAREAGQIFNPVGSNAIELFAAAASADPGNEVIAAEFGAVIEQALGMAETALLEARVDDADAALQRVAEADPGNARVPFLSAQLSQMQLRGYLADARAAIRDERFEDAANALDAAQALGLADDTEIAAVMDELTAAQNSQQSDEVLALANARLEEGDLLSPANDNARYYYELVISSDPNNTAARQGLNVIASKLVLQARGEIDRGNFIAAEGLLGDARQVDPSNAELTAAAGALLSAKQAVAEQRRQAVAQREAEEERQAAEAQAELDRQAAAASAEADRRAAEERAAVEAAAVAAAANQQPAETPGNEAAATDTVAVASSSEPLDTAQDGAGVAQGEQVASVRNQPPTETGATQNTQSNQGAGADYSRPANTLVGISSLNRVKYVAPKYPRSAERRNVSGWVDVVFTVAMDGSVKDIEVRNSEPREIFDNAASKAVEKWKFEPVIENGVIVEKRAGVRMMFALE